MFAQSFGNEVVTSAVQTSYAVDYVFLETINAKRDTALYLTYELSCLPPPVATTTVPSAAHGAWITGSA